jgi:hypothetical protein
MAKVSTMEKVGVWSFYIGLIIAVIFSFMGDQWWTASILLLLGLIVGILNVTDKEIVPFLIACIALIVAGSAASGLLPWVWLNRFLGNVVIFVIPAALLGALKGIYAIASSK